MDRFAIAPRRDWVKKVEEVGFTYHSFGKNPDDADGVYWDESIFYSFALPEVELIEAATQELHARCLDAVDYIVANPQEMDHFQIPHAFRDLIVESWRRRDPYVMGRFDLAYDPESGAVKMLEYNADTPTLVIESALVQWQWLQDCFPANDQFNSLHEKLIARYRQIAERMPSGSTMVFSSLPNEPTATYQYASVEEYNHVQYFMDLAQQAGMKVSYCSIPDIGWDSTSHDFVDACNNTIHFWSKLYPWEWLVKEDFGGNLLHDKVGVVEPIWKMLLSNKAIMPILWKLFPNHPNLLPTFFEPGPLLGGDYIVKPILAREGANIEIVSRGATVQKTEGSYGDGPKIYQQLAKLPQFDGNNVVIGSWVVGEEPAGMILRESANAIVVNTSKVVPHLIES